LPTTNARKTIKGSKDADFGQVFQKETKNSSYGLGPRVGQKILNLPPLCSHPQKTQIQNFPIFFIETAGLAESLEGLNSCLAQPAGGLYDNKPGQIVVVKAF